MQMGLFEKLLGKRKEQQLPNNVEKTASNTNNQKKELQHKNQNKSSLETRRCARCKKEITEGKEKQIGNHIFCQKCGSPYQGKSVIPGNTFSNGKSHPEEYESEFCLQQLYEPSHVGETEHGFSIVKTGNKLYIKHSAAYAKPGSTTQYYDELIPIPDEVKTLDELYSYTAKTRSCQLPNGFCGNKTPLSDLFCEADDKNFISQKKVDLTEIITNDKFKNNLINVSENREVFGHGMGQLRRLTILYKSHQIGLFYIQQEDSNAGTAYRYLILPKGHSENFDYYIEHENEFSGWISGWYTDAIMRDMTR